MIQVLIKIWHKIDLPRLKVGQWHEHQALKKKNKETYPVRFFLFRTIPRKFGALKMRISRRWYKIRGAVWDRYNVIKIDTLSSTWNDVVEQMLHVNFQLLVDYIEKEEPFKRIDWHDDPAHEHAYNEMKDLYHWWKNVYPLREEELPEFPPNIEMKDILQNPEKKPHPDYEEWKRIADIHHKTEEEWSKEEEEQLIRLMKIRQFLWT